MIKNYMEDVVEKIINDLLDNNDEYKQICRCESCIDDIKAKALNNLKPFYITGKKGEIYGEYYFREFQNNTNVVMEVVKAIECVKTNKNHNNIVKI